MRQRCENENYTHYHHYGGRGISVCPEWHQYEIFKTWALSHGYSDTLTIDRIDVNGPYCPSNCRWATKSTQNNNRRNNRYVTYQGERHTVKEWADILDMPYDLLKTRIDRGWDIEDAFKRRRQERGQFEYKGQCHTLREWADITGIPFGTLSNRIWNEKQPMDVAIETPVKHNDLISYGDEAHSIQEWSRITGIGYSALKWRINVAHWPIEKALTTPSKKK